MHMNCLGRAKNDGVHPYSSFLERAFERFIHACQHGTISVAGNMPGKASHSTSGTKLESRK